MKKNLYIPILAVVLLISGYIAYLNIGNSSEINEANAISILKEEYVEFENYTTDNLSLQQIQTEKDTNGWYVAFIQNGSGRPIIGAKCFYVDNDKNIKIIGEYTPTLIGDTDFSLKTCSN